MNIFFLSGLPRSGNTILSSLINQSPYTKVTPYSMSPMVLGTLLNHKQHTIFQNFPDHEAVDNVLRNYYNNYYAHYNVENIIERAPWGIPNYLNILKQVKVERKFIVMYRPILEVLASFVAKDKPIDKKAHCEYLMSSSMITEGLKSIEGLIDNQEQCKLILYDEFVKDPIQVVKEISDFLQIPFYKPNLQDISQFKINGILYDDTVNQADYHTIRTHEIKKSNIVVEEILPERIIEKYKGYDLL